MKMHTFFLSGKAIAIVSGAVGACGMLLFVSGVLVGVRVQAHAPEARCALFSISGAPQPQAVARCPHASTKATLMPDG